MDSPVPPLGTLIAAVNEQANSPANRVASAVDLKDALAARGQELVDAVVRAARAGGCSWEEIGRQFGVSRQAAQQRFSTSR